MVSSWCGDQPLWAADGSELYYRHGFAMMAFPIRTQPVFRAGTPVRLFEGNLVNQNGSRRDYDLEYPEGRRFLMVEDLAPEVASTKLVHVESWSRVLEGLVPVDSGEGRPSRRVPAECARRRGCDAPGFV